MLREAALAVLLRPVVWMVTTVLPPAVMVAGDAVVVNPPGSGVPPAIDIVPEKPYNAAAFRGWLPVWHACAS